ncbi:iron siderophore-binding protein [Paenibacillus tyrfis]|nr:iron siderophore-binding protein [Paenibacillus tyrfis]
MLKQFRFRMSAFFLLCMMIVLAGCGTKAPETGGNAANGTDSKGAATASAPAAKADEVRKIKHIMGETEIKGTPKRVVVLTNEGTEAVLALGIKPVGAIQSWEGEPWHDHIKAEMHGVAVLGYEDQPNLEAIAQLNPDLILGNKTRHEKIYEQLSKIAPTVFSEDLTGRWKINFNFYADVLNKKAEGEKVMKEFDQRVADAKAKLGPKLASKVSIVKFSFKGTQIYKKDTFSGVLLEQLGFARPASQDKPEFAEMISQEKMDLMDGDILFYWVSESKGKNDVSNKAKEWFDSPVFKNLNVAKNNKVFKVNETIWNTAGGIKAANLLLDDILKRFEVK